MRAAIRYDDSASPALLQALICAFICLCAYMVGNPAIEANTLHRLSEYCASKSMNDGFTTHPVISVAVSDAACPSVGPNTTVGDVSSLLNVAEPWWVLLLVDGSFAVAVIFALYAFRDYDTGVRGAWTATYVLAAATIYTLARHLIIDA
jgi:hypothetical protein